MKIIYNLSIPNPSSHILEVSLTGKFPAESKELEIFMPSWSPGSYLMREYGRNIRTFEAFCEGKSIKSEQTAKGVYLIKGTAGAAFEVKYEVYCHELTVRTSHIDASHAFLHGPSVLMGVKDFKMPNPELIVEMPKQWSRISTGLVKIAENHFTAEDYDVLIDAPLEIGNHFSDTFTVKGKEHEVAFWGESFADIPKLKEDMQKIVETVAEFWDGDIPYDRYVFITHLKPKTFGGLEHLNSTALQYCSLDLATRKGYVDWLSLVSHEYFHTWNVKRIRPAGISEFDYLNENYTSMLWLAEGFTNFMDHLLVYRGGLCSQQEYLNHLKMMFNRLEGTPGRKFHSLEQSSFNAWIKLYRPDENSINSSVSYYLKGAIVFHMLQIMLTEKKLDLQDLGRLLWQRYKDNPAVGVSTQEVLKMIEELAGKAVRNKFKKYISTCDEINIKKHLKDAGCEIIRNKSDETELGIKVEYNNEQVMVKSVLHDSAAYKSGLNAGDEIIAIERMRIVKSTYDKLQKILKKGRSYSMTICRLGVIQELDFIVEEEFSSIKALEITDKKLWKKTYGGQ